MTERKNKNGEVYLDFILGTHNHYDHIGCFYDIINDNEIKIGRAYFKEYNTEIATELEQDGWDNVATYNNIIKALNEKDIVIIKSLPDWEFSLGDFKLQFINTVTPKELNGNGENANSVGVIVTKGEKRAFLFPIDVP